jgi:hypothetical protein
MNSDRIIHLATMNSGKFREYESTTCQDCEIRFRLQIMIAELLRKNQMLRMELQELRCQISMPDQS